MSTTDTTKAEPISIDAIRALWKRYCCEGAFWVPFDDSHPKHLAARWIESACIELLRYEADEQDSELRAVLHETVNLLNAVGVAIDARHAQELARAGGARLKLVPSPGGER